MSQTGVASRKAVLRLLWLSRLSGTYAVVTRAVASGLAEKHFAATMDPHKLIFMLYLAWVVSSATRAAGLPNDQPRRALHDQQQQLDNKIDGLDAVPITKGVRGSRDNRYSE